MDPLSAFGPLTSNIYHSKSDLFEVEGMLDDTCSGNPRTEDVLLGWQVIGLCYSIYVRQVAEKLNKILKSPSDVKGRFFKMVTAKLE